MTTPITAADRMRKDFESYVAANDASIERRPTGDYVEDTTESAWRAWQAAKQTPMVYDPTPRKSILTDEAVEAGVKVLQDLEGDETNEAVAKAVFHAMEAYLPTWSCAAESHPVRFVDYFGAKHELTLARAAEELRVWANHWPCGLEEIDAAIKAAATPAAQAQEPEWTSMETSPPNGVLRLFCDMKSEVLSKTFFVDWVVDGKFCGDRTGKATHWMPLPSFPATTPDPKQSA